MKKLAILTSILALTACGGGSGSGGGSAPIMPDAPVVPEAPVTPENPDAPVVPETQFVDPIAISNLEITGMVSNSEYQVARYVAHKLGDYADDVNLSRSATTRGAFVPKKPTDDKDYDTARELVDLAAWLVDDTTSESDIVEMFNKSTLDKNKIKSALKLMDDMYCFVGGDAVETARRIKEHDFEKPLADLQQKTEVFDLENVTFVVADIMDTAGLRDKVKFKTDKNGEIDNIILLYSEKDGTYSEEIAKRVKLEDDIDEFHSDFGNAKHVVHLFGYDQGMKFADFGYFERESYEDGEEISENVSLAGGYETNIVEPQKTMTFKGRAVGGVKTEHDFNGTEVEPLPLDAMAELQFNAEDKSETLTMDFTEDGWYNVTVQTTGYNTAEQTTSITFDGGDNIVSDEHKFQTVTADNKTFELHEANIGVNGIHGFVETKYYGKGDPSEVTGIVAVRETTNADTENNARETTFSVAFGGIAQ